MGASTALLCLSLASLVALMPQRRGIERVPHSLVAAGLASLVVGALHPPPWLLATALLVLLTLVWNEAFIRHARLGEPFVENGDG